MWDGAYVQMNPKELVEAGLMKHNLMKCHMCLAKPLNRACNAHGMTALHLAVALDQPKCLEVLLAHCRTYKQDEQVSLSGDAQGRSALKLADELDRKDMFNSIAMFLGPDDPRGAKYIYKDTK